MPQTEKGHSLGQGKRSKNTARTIQTSYFLLYSRLVQTDQAPTATTCQILVLVCITSTYKLVHFVQAFILSLETYQALHLFPAKSFTVFTTNQNARDVLHLAGYLHRANSILGLCSCSITVQWTRDDTCPYRRCKTSVVKLEATFMHQRIHQWLPTEHKPSNNHNMDNLLHSNYLLRQAFLSIGHLTC